MMNCGFFDCRNFEIGDPICEVCIHNPECPVYEGEHKKNEEGED